MGTPRSSKHCAATLSCPSRSVRAELYTPLGRTQLPWIVPWRWQGSHGRQRACKACYQSVRRPSRSHNLVVSGPLLGSTAPHGRPRRCKSSPIYIKGKGKGFPYSIPSVGPGADPGVQAVSPQVTVSHPPGGRLPLLSARPAVTSPAAEHHRPLTGTKLYCLVTEVHRCEQLA